MNRVARRETPLAIAALVLWVLTAAAGLVLFITGSAARRAGGAEGPGQQTAGQQAPSQPAPGQPGPGHLARAGQRTGQQHTGQQAVPAPAAAVTVPPAATAAARPVAPPRGPGPAAGPAEPPPIPRVKVHARPGEHPLLEFSHPALGLIGMGLWFVYVGTRHAPLAWASFGILVAAIAAGLSWLARNRLAARRGGRPARAGFPPRLVLLHGLTATGTFALAVLTALAASHI
jgi:hypothetical protein